MIYKTEVYMKRTTNWLVVVSILLVMLLSFSLVACGGNTTDTNTDTNTGTNTDTDTDTNTDNNPDTPGDDSTDEPETYKVIFRQNGFEDIVLDIERGSAPDLPAPQPETGYVVTWEVTEFSNLSSDSIVGVHRIPVQYGITYVVGEGVNNEENPSEINIETEIILKNPSRVGCEFNGWYEDEACTKKITTISKGKTAPVTVYAGWTPIEYTISYTLDGGNNNTQNLVKYTVDSNFTLLNPSKADHDFDGWYNAETDTRVETTEDFVGNVTLVAKWIFERFDITYVGVKPNEHENPADFDKTQTITFKDPSREGYTFGGWYKDANYTQKITGISAGTLENITVYAKMTAVKYTIQYVVASGVTANSGNINEYTVDTDFELLPPSFSDGFEFDGWFIQGTNQKVEVIVPGGDLKQNLVLEAKVGYKKYNITFNTDDGELPENTQDYFTVENTGSNALKLPTPTKNGYRFMGWYTDSEFNSAPLTSIDGAKKADVVLYARWNLAKYVITYDYGIAGTGVTNSNPTTFDMNNAVEFTKPAKEGYIFIGWYTDSSLNNVINTTEGLYSNLTVYAKWIIGSNIADQATITTTSTTWVCDNSTMKWLVDGDRHTAIGGDYNAGSYTLTFKYDNEHFVTSVVVVCNGSGIYASHNPQKEIEEVTTNSFDIILTAYDKDGNVVYNPTTKNPNGKEAVEFEINANVAKIEIKVYTSYNGSRYLWEVEVNAGA